MDRYYFFIVLFCLSPFLISQGSKNAKKGFLVLMRPENNGVINIRECYVQIDSSKDEIILIGEDEKKINLSTGYHTIYVHSKDPYDPNTADDKWKSNSAKFKISVNKITTFKIEPKSNSNGYCCGWQLTRIAK
jgi:hypothetical protein